MKMSRWRKGAGGFFQFFPHRKEKRPQITSTRNFSAPFFLEKKVPLE
jgi:hypothetical protein